jgi:2-oxo-4-hydroxy-4-carboxy-5-ureidoimidazoline decarboxylase
MTVEELDRAPEASARGWLAACCGAGPWVTGMLAARPFRDREGLLAAADRAWARLAPAEVAEAVAHHPRLGSTAAAVPLDERARAWSAGEQAGAHRAGADVRAALAAGNEAYERRFGHTFILCASGLSAAQMLAELERRLANDAESERATTARELHRITRLRLEKLLAGD